ncbi:FCD domain-containing protein [Ruminococcaceae bacterium OttesenSCG-928-I18]|nr:FCD domain-containing protein [Ruminococcaceae bacterium OttesenSCG-928-I18]
MAKKISTEKLLQKIEDFGTPVGAIYLSQEMDVSQATIGRLLKDTEDAGYLERIGNKGRQLTAEGRVFLQDQKNVQSKKRTANSLINYVANTSPEKLLEILQARKLLEGFTVRHACMNVTDAHLTELDDIMMEHIAEIRCGGLGNEQDLKIHLTIAKISGNMTIYQVLKLILTEDNAYKVLPSVDDSVRKNQMIQHSDIIQMVKEHNADRAEQAMQDHLDSVIENVKILSGMPKQQL